jgi:cellobiose phosphorylase
MRYGYFDDERREYVITNPKTPVKWINYIGTLAFGGFIDHTGGALLCKGDPAKNRITKYVQQEPAYQFRGTTLYIRIEESDGYRLLTPFFVPGLEPLTHYECHVGLGYSRFVSEAFELRVETTVFVPDNASCELRDIRITNLAGRERRIDIVPVVEYSHPNAIMLFTNADWVPQTMVSRAVQDPDGRVILVQYPFMHRDTQVNYFTSSAAVDSFETDRKRFLGDNEYGTWAHPLALDSNRLSDYEADRGENIAALLHRPAPLGPGTSVRIITQLGQARSVEAARESIERFRDPDRVDQAFAAMGRYWDAYLGAMQVETPDPGMNHMVNVHNPHQCAITCSWSRYLSFYQLGMGARGIGFRDSAQDALGVMAAAPTRARELITMLLGIQRRNGSAYHQMNPLTGEASVGEAGEYGGEDVDFYGDDHLWAVLAVCDYCKETGDYEYLDRRIPFYDRDQSGAPLEEASVYEHCRRAIEFTARTVGAHGLPLLGYADWNDCVNLRSGAESLFIANLFGVALREMRALCTVRGDTEGEARYREQYERMKARVNEHAWDGAWYVRYFDANGAALGSRDNEVGRIYANGQSWPVMSGFATPERGRQALDSVRAMLNTDHGVKLAAPGYDGFDPDVGGISTYPPGAKENGGIFLHANPWIIIAETLLGNGDQAYRYYCQINPAARNDAIEGYEVEPYVYAQNILGDEHPLFGLGRNSWLSGTASWSYQAATRYILGVRAEHHGLLIDPCIPRAWDGFSLTRKFRGATYRITIDNPDHVSTGVASMTVDGAPAADGIAPVFGDGAEHVVRVTLGRRSRGYAKP